MDTKTSTASQVLEAIGRAERTKKWTADKAGISITTFNRKIRGGGDFTVGEVYRIAVALGEHPADLLPNEFSAVA